MKRLKIFVAAILLTIFLTSSLAFINRSYHDKAFVTKCFIYVGPTSCIPPIRPTSSDMQNKNNWVEVIGGTVNCPPPRQTICAICFDDATYPLDPNGKPPFVAGSTFTNTVLAHYNSPADHDLTFNGIRFLYRACPQ